MTNPPSAEHILMIRPSALGDVCRTVPVLASLRAAYPRASIDWVVQEDFAPAIAAHPALNNVVGFPRSRFAQWWRSPATSLAMVQWFARLRKAKYDLAIDCQGLGRSGLMAFASAAKRRVGLRAARELAWLGYTERLPRRASDSIPRHTVDQMLLLVYELGIEPVRDMRLYAAPDDLHWWRQRRAPLQVSEPYAVLAPTARWLSKRWPIERFAQLLEPLAHRGFCAAIIIGAPGEQDQVAVLPRSRFVLNMVGELTIGQTMAVIADAGLVVANDSAPLHMAVGFDRPCVGLFGPTDPSIVGPYRRESAVVRGYAAAQNESINFKDSKLGDRLMRLISTVAVVQKIDQVLAEWNPAPRGSHAKAQARRVTIETKMNGPAVEGAA